MLRCTEMRSLLGRRALVTNRDGFRAGVKDDGVRVSALNDAGAETVKQPRFPWGDPLFRRGVKVLLKLKVLNHFKSMSSGWVMFLAKKKNDSIRIHHMTNSHMKMLIFKKGFLSHFAPRP